MTPRLKTALTLLVGITIGALSTSAPALADVGWRHVKGRWTDWTDWNPNMGALARGTTRGLSGDDMLGRYDFWDEKTKSYGPKGSAWKFEMGMGNRGASCTVTLPADTDFTLTMTKPADYRETCPGCTQGYKVTQRKGMQEPNVEGIQ
jgi:hypothetical protein